MLPPKMMWYGDDFTGATDTLQVISDAGLVAMLFMSLPDETRQARAAQALGGELDALGLAGATRSLDPAAIRSTLEPVGRFFARSGCRLLHYKICSTFDSSPQVGNIAAAVAALRAHVGHDWVPVVGGQPSLGRYCVFGHLFAAAGLGGTVVRIDRHPTMSVHPMTPMRESDLCRHLQAQGLEPMLSWHYPHHDEPPELQWTRLQSLLAQRPAAMLIDVSSARELASIGRLLWTAAGERPLLSVGPSGVAQALIAHWRASGVLAAGGRTLSGASLAPIGPATGPVWVFAGSLSPITARQVAAALSYTRIQLPVADLLEDGASARALAESVVHALANGQNTLVYTAPDEGQAADTTQSSRIARASAAWVGRSLTQLLEQGVRLGRLGIAGGDTSSLAVQSLPIWGLSYRGALDTGVSLCRAHSDDTRIDGLELILKGGQMGGLDIFERLVRGRALT